MENVQYKSARKQKQYEQKVSDELGKDVAKALKREEVRKEQKEKRKSKIRESNSYRAIESIKKWMDQYMLDGIIGLVPVLGDGVTKILSLPFIYVAFVKVKSIPLTLAIVFNILLDFLIGLIPYFVGNVADFFFKSYKKNFELIVGFVDDDREVIKKVNERAIWMALGITIVCYLIYLVVGLVISMVTTVYEWINSLFV